MWSKWVFCIVVSAVLLGLVIARTDTSRFGLLAANTHWGWWAFGLTLTLLVPIPLAQRSRLLLRSLGYRVSLGSVAAVNLEAMFFNLALPGELVGGVVRWDRFARHTGNRTGAFTLLATERIIDWMLLALVTASGASLLFGGESAPRLRAGSAAVAGAILVLGCATVLAGRSRQSARAVQALRARCRPRTEVWVERLERLLEAARTLADDGRSTSKVLFWTTALWCLAFAGGVIMARAVFPQMPVLPYGTAMAALALLVQIPLTVAGVGLRELSLPVLLGAYGVTVEMGLLIGLSAFLPYFLLGLVGFALRLAGRAKLEKERSAAP